MATITHKLRSRQPLRRSISALAAILCLACAEAQNESDDDNGATLAPSRVAALGRIEPGEGVIDVGAPPGSRVGRLDVEEGERVDSDQLLGVLDSYAPRLAERQRLRALVDEAQVQLRRARQFGPLEVQAQEADVRRLETELALAKSDLDRIEALRAEEVVPEQTLEHQRAVTERARETLHYARAVLEKLRRQQDLAVAEGEARLATANGNLAAGEALLELAEIRSPVSGEVLKIFAWPGEQVTNRVLQVGETGRMYAVAEVYETDVRFLRIGQAAKIRSPAIADAIGGRVERIGKLIYRNDVLSLDPTADRDTRVVEVRIRLDEPSPASSLTHLQVDVEIDTGASGEQPPDPPGEPPGGANDETI